jgi:hypothetical protein
MSINLTAWTTKTKALVGFFAALAALAAGVVVLAKNSQPIVCSVISAPWCHPAPPPLPAPDQSGPELAVGSTGWVYVGARGGGRRPRTPRTTQVEHQSANRGERVAIDGAQIDRPARSAAIS